MSVFKKALLLILTFVCAASFAQTSKEIIILPNIGIDDIEIGQTKIEDLSTFRGELVRTKTHTTIRCGTGRKRKERGFRARFTNRISEDLGIVFTFTEKELHRRKELWSIPELTSITIAGSIRTYDGISVGSSTKNDVLAVYGPLPNGWDHEAYIYFNEQGIAFDFNENGTLTRIKVFKIRS